MQYCVDCNIKVVEVLGFSKDRSDRFRNIETKHRKTTEKELSFGEILEETIKNSKERN